MDKDSKILDQQQNQAHLSSSQCNHQGTKKHNFSKIALKFMEGFVEEHKKQLAKNNVSSILGVTVFSIIMVCKEMLQVDEMDNESIAGIKSLHVA